MAAGLRLGAVTFALCAALVVACDEGEPSKEAQPLSQPGAADEFTAYDGDVCPKELPESEVGDRGFGTDEPAEAAPEFPAIDRAWVCRYDPDLSPMPDGNGSRVTWVRAGIALSKVIRSRLPGILDSLEDLAPISSDDDRRCTADDGPRWLLVVSTPAGDLIGVSVDDFGCEEVRITVDPHRIAPGDVAEGNLAGVLEGSTGLPTTLSENWTATGLCDRSCQPTD